VVIDDFNTIGTSGCPDEADAPLAIDTDAVLPCAVAFQGLQLVIRRHGKILQHLGITERLDSILISLSWRDPACYRPAMLELVKVNDVVNRAATATLKRQAGVQRVFSEPASDSEGIDALRITIVLTRGSADKISGDKALNTLVGIERALREAGEDRFPIIGYVTEEELESSGDTES
jgi:hypothetical protein